MQTHIPSHTHRINVYVFTYTIYIYDMCKCMYIIEENLADALRIREILYFKHIVLYYLHLCDSSLDDRYEVTS